MWVWPKLRKIEVDGGIISITFNQHLFGNSMTPHFPLSINKLDGKWLVDGDTEEVVTTLDLDLICINDFFRLPSFVHKTSTTMSVNKMMILVDGETEDEWINTN